MEHPCAKCGSPVEDGRPFCPQCRAPQVRVLIEPQTSEPSSGSTGSLSNPEAFLTSTAVRSGGLDRKIAVRAALLAGVLGLVVNVFIPLLGIVLTGALAVLFYRLSGGSALSVRRAWRLGAAAWTVAFAIFSFLFVTSITAYHAQFQDEMIKRMQAFGVDLAAPGVEEGIRFVLSPAGLTLSLLLYFAIGIVLAAIGGALAASLARPRT